ncbi:MAG: efflux RND transporter periplasmic adaptor subunit [Gammaproteobacteria bacterium]|nr:efflux RND transporter periplasmic adaptor subunit [Gammaproteobacteria bacterium]
MAAVGVVLTAACSPEPAGQATQEPSLTVTTAQPGERTLNQALTVSGSVAAWQEMSLGVELSGVRAAEVLVEVGDRVRAGAPLLRLDARTLEVQARQADAGVAQARANLDLARSNFTRGEQLVGQGLVSASDVEELRAKLTSAEAQLVTAQADRDAARLRLSFATLRAPDDGVISARSVQPGQVVNAGNELLRMIRRGRLEWRAELTEADLARVPVGATVDLAGPRGERVSGRVRAVAPAVDPATRAGLLYADLPEPGNLRAGMFAEGRVLLGEVEVPVLPRDAIVFRDGIPYVFVAGGTDAKATTFTVTQRRIGIGIQQGDFTEVRSGLQANERVVVRGAGFLGDGDLVREADARAAAVTPSAPPAGQGAP